MFVLVIFRGRVFVFDTSKRKKKRRRDHFRLKFTCEERVGHEEGLLNVNGITKPYALH